MDEQTPKNANSSGERSNGGQRSSAVTVGGVAVSIVIVIALAVGAYALFRMDSWDAGAAKDSKRFDLDLSSHVDVPANVLGYVEKGRRSVSLQDPVAIACATDGAVFVAGDRAIEVLHPTGNKESLPLKVQPSCLAVSDSDGDESRLYVGAGKQVVVLNREGDMLHQWPAASEKSVLTSIAVSGEHVFVADAGQKLVLRYDRDGTLQGTIGQADPKREMPGFVIPSPYFDLVMGSDELLYVVNPGMRRVEAYNLDGELQSYWGQEGSALPDFFGCCNPAHLSLLPDGRFITSEKGIPRIKVYSATGDMELVVAAPKQLGVAASALGDARGNQKERVFDVTVSQDGTVLVLDAHARQVLSFTPKSSDGESES